MSDKMPDDLYARRVGKKKFSAVTKESPLALGGFVAFSEARPAKPRTRYVRADLPKEVDLKAISKSCALAAQHYPRKITDSYIEEGVLRTIKHLVALGVIKDKT